MTGSLATSAARSRRLPRATIALGVLALAVTAGMMPAQQPQPAAPAGQAGQGGGDQNGTEVLARGPVHEAYADTSAVSAPTPIVTKQPPDGIDEAAAGPQAGRRQRAVGAGVLALGRGPQGL